MKEGIEYMSVQQNSYESSKNDRLWKSYDEPIRNIILWGYNTISKNPCLLILYGQHQFMPNSNKWGDKLLVDNVIYTNYAIFEGFSGHLPPIPKTRIFFKDSFSNSEMFYKSNLDSYSFWEWKWNRADFSKYLIKEYKKLNKGLEIPYFEFKSLKPTEKYKKYIEILREKNIKFPNFDFIDNPNELLNLTSDEMSLYDTIFDTINNNSIYMRKKRLDEFLNMNPEKEVYIKLFKIGNVEFLSGLFLELAKRNNPILIDEAKYTYSTKDLWSEEKYMKGLIRCSLIYINTFDREKTKRVIDGIYKHIDELIPETSSNYCGYYYLGDYKRFKKNTYNDGKYFIDSQIKNTLQSAEVFQLTDVLGKFGYFFDSPKLSKFFIGERERKKFNYYGRYIIRAINSIAQKDSDKFIEIMRTLLTSYEVSDCGWDFSNKLILFYLYNSYDGYNLMNDEGRFEYKKEIWDSHIDDVIYITINTDVLIIQKACYYILADALKNFNIPDLSYQDLILLTEKEYKPISTMFNSILMLKLNDAKSFDYELMLALMNAKTEALHNIAVKYFVRTNGKFTPKYLAEFLKQENIEEWTQLFEESLKNLSPEEYMDFIQEVINNSQYFIEAKTEISEDILNLIKNLIEFSKVPFLSKQNFVKNIVDKFLRNIIMPDFVLEIIENFVFSLSYDDLYKILKDISFEYNSSICEKYLNFISLFKSVKYEIIPEDSSIISILETGGSKMVKLLIELCDKFKLSLSLNFSALLIMLESDIYRLNEISKNVFETMDVENQKKFHLIILDSPVSKVYKYGLEKLYEIYKNEIPKDFIIQLLEHTAPEVKAYISDKTNDIINNMGFGDASLYIYYIKTLLYLPNRVSKGKDNIYKTIPHFVKLNPQKKAEIQNILLDIGSSNIKVDSERALVTFAEINF